MHNPFSANLFIESIDSSNLAHDWIQILDGFRECKMTLRIVVLRPDQFQQAA